MMAKRIMDVLLSALMLISLSPIIVVIAVLVRWKLGSPILFRQARPGLNGSQFQMLKFRTMRDLVGSAGEPLPDKDRITPFGRALRASSLDELPELVNVLRGHMSLVGPRPLLVEYLPLYSQEQSRRHSVKPGITGWAQINGRNALTWTEKFALDVWYVENRTFLLDLKILLRTFIKVLRRDGINPAGEDTMPRFRRDEPR